MTSPHLLGFCQKTTALRRLAWAALILGSSVAACKRSGDSTTASATAPAPAPAPQTKTLQQAIAQMVQQGPALTPPNNTWMSIETTPITPAQFKMVVVPSDGLEKTIIPGSDAQHIPPNLQGIWWMDGNKLAPGNVTSFAAAAWDLPNHRMLIKEAGVNNYSFNGDDSGWKSFNQSVASNLCFEVQFNDDYTHGQLIEVMALPNSWIVVRFPKAAIDYQMDLVADGDWYRASWWAGIQVPDYHLRRIVDGQGNRVEPAYSNFLKVAPPNSYIPVALNSPAAAAPAAPPPSPPANPSAQRPAPATPAP